MDWVQVIFLSILQGVLEFLPISSSGHLILFPALLGWQDQGLAFDIAVHAGSFLAIIIYFKKDIVSIVFRNSIGIDSQKNTREFLFVILATLPILIIGFFISDEFLAFLRMPKVIATATGVFGILLWWTDRTFEGSQKLDKVNAKGFLFIGLMQVIALIPGTSRSGITITAGRVLGINRTEATRFSFLLAIPTIGASIVWQGLEFINTTQVVEWNKLFIAVILSALSSWLSIALFLKFIQLIQFSWFMGYRLFLAGLTFIVL